jgi:hypothetical protein
MAAFHKSRSSNPLQRMFVHEEGFWEGSTSESLSDKRARGSEARSNCTASDVPANERFSCGDLHEQESVPIGFRFCDEIGTDCGTGTRSVFHDERLLELVLKLLG